MGNGGLVSTEKLANGLLASTFYAAKPTAENSQTRCVRRVIR